MLHLRAAVAKWVERRREEPVVPQVGLRRVSWRPRPGVVTETVHMNSLESCVSESWKKINVDPELDAAERELQAAKCALAAVQQKYISDLEIISDLETPYMDAKNKYYDAVQSAFQHILEQDRNRAQSKWFQFLYPKFLYMTLHPVKWRSDGYRETVRVLGKKYEAIKLKRLEMQKAKLDAEADSASDFNLWLNRRSIMIDKLSGGDSDLAAYIDSICLDQEYEWKSPLVDATVKHVLWKVFSVALVHAEHETIFCSLKLALLDGKMSCQTGQISRVMLVLAGLVPEVVVSQDSTDWLRAALQDHFARLRAEYSKDPAKCEEEANTLLTAAKVTPADRQAWMDALVS
jgi:hypothetical protein